MAYSKKTWKARQGLGLNKFSIDGATPVPITNQPDSVTQQGDALSAGNLNDLEDRIANAFDDVETSKADKATTDDLQSQIDQHEARLSNLEQVSGEYVQTDMQDYSTVPTGKASYALVETMKGVSRVENQLISTTDFPSATRQGVTFTNNGDGTITADSSGSPATGYAYTSYAPTLVVGHSYLLFGSARQSNCGMSVTSPPVYDTGDGVVFSANIANPTIYIYVQTGETVSNLVYRPNLVDLTLYFNNGGTLPTLAEIQQYYPELLEPRAYNVGEIVDSTYSEVRSESKQLWNEQAEWGSYGGEVGEHYTKTEPYSTWNGIRSAEPIPVKPNTTYWVGFSTALNTYIQIQYLDSDGIIIGFASASLNGYSFTTPSNCVAITMRTNSEYGSKTYRHDILLCYNSVTDKTYTPYWSPVTLTIPTVTLKGAGSVSDTLDVERGEITRRAVALDLGDLTWENYNDTNGIFKTIVSGVINRYGSSSSVAEMTCARYFPDTANRVSSGNTNGTIGLNGGGSTLYVYDSSYAKDASVFKTGVTGIKVILELATPTTESVTPTLNNTLKTEGGGSVHSDADVDGRFTLGFLNL